MPDQSPPNPLDTPRRASQWGLWPIGIVFVAFALWSGYWLFMAQRIEQQVKTRQDALIHTGYEANSDPYSVAGWPYRFRVVLRNVTLISPTGRGFAAPEIDVQADAYNLDKWIVDVPGSLTLFRGHRDGIDLGKLAVTAKTLRASVSGMRNPVHNIAIQATGLALTPSDATHPFLFTTADDLEAYMRPTGGVDKTAGDDSADVLLEVSGAHGVPGSMAGDLSPSAPLSLHVESRINKASAFAQGAPAWAAGGGQIQGFKSQIVAGKMTLMASSDALGVDANGALSGKMDVAVSGTAQPLEILAAARLISPENMTLAKPLLDMGLAISGTPKFTIDFRKGSAYIGPLKVSSAPILLVRQ